MAKQKPVIKTRVHTKAAEHKQTLHMLHRRRAWWFTVLISGLVLIQFAYNIHSDGQPRVLGYATSISAETLLKDTNDYRSRSNVSTLHENEALDRAAQAKADSMIEQNYWSHVAPDGTTPWYYFQKVGYNYSAAGENLAYGFATADQVITAWMNSQEHRDNVLGNYQDVGFGFANGDNYQDGKNTVVVAMYGLSSYQNPAGEPNQHDTPTAITTIANGPQHVNGATSIINGNAPWATYASMALLGATILGFLVTHLETLKLGWHNARKYAILHPAVDAAVLLVIALVVVQAAGGFIR